MTEKRFDDRLCCVCRRPAIGLGVSNRARKVEDIGWVCNDRECIDIAERTYSMKQLEFARIDDLATTVDGMGAAEQYCDKIGKTDFRDFTEHEAQEFCRQLVGAYRSALKGRLRDEAPF